jgi:hypothetical protein
VRPFKTDAYSIAVGLMLVAIAAIAVALIASARVSA